MPSDYRIADVTLPVGPVPMILFMGRPARLTLIIAASTAGTTFVATSEADFNSHIFARIPSSTTLIMPLRDFGPLITGEIWVNNTSGSQLINGAEVFEVPKRR